jgi:hypothetical protein
MHKDETEVQEEEEEEKSKKVLHKILRPFRIRARFSPKCLLFRAEKEFNIYVRLTGYRGSGIGLFWRSISTRSMVNMTLHFHSMASHNLRYRSHRKKGQDMPTFMQFTLNSKEHIHTN